MGDGPVVETRQVIGTRPGNDNSYAQDIVLLSFLTNVHIVSVCVYRQSGLEGGVLSAEVGNIQILLAGLIA